MEEVEGDQPSHNIIIMTLQLKVKGQGFGTVRDNNITS